MGEPNTRLERELRKEIEQSDRTRALGVMHSMSRTHLMAETAKRLDSHRYLHCGTKGEV